MILKKKLNVKLATQGKVKMTVQMDFEADKISFPFAETMLLLEKVN